MYRIGWVGNSWPIFGPALLEQLHVQVDVEVKHYPGSRDLIESELSGIDLLMIELQCWNPRLKSEIMSRLSKVMSGSSIPVVFLNTLGPLDSEEQGSLKDQFPTMRAIVHVPAIPSELCSTLKRVLEERGRH